MLTRLQKNDNGLLNESMKANATLWEIKDVAKKHYHFVGEHKQITNKKLEELTNFDKPLQDVLNGTNDDNMNTADYIVNNLGSFANEGFLSINENVASMSNYVSSEIVSDISQHIEKAEEDCTTVFSEISNNFAQIQGNAATGQKDISNLVQRQKEIGDTLQHTVTSKCSQFHNDVIEARRSEIENHCLRVTEDAANHMIASKNEFSSMRDMSDGISQKVSAYTDDVVHMNDPTSPADPRKEIPYSTHLSSTPSEQVIMSTLNEKLHNTPQDENGNLNTNFHAPKLDSRDDASIESPRRNNLSPFSPSKQNSPKRKRPVTLR